MAIFGKKTEKSAESAAAPKVADQSGSATAATDATATVIRRPHITEKAFGLSQRNVYTFEVQKNANKHEVKAAVQAIYNVTPERVRIVNKRPRVVRSLMRSKPAHQSGLKKAYVYLKEGDTINFM